MIEKGKTYEIVAKDGCHGLYAKVLHIHPGDLHPYKCRVSFKDGSKQIIYFAAEDLSDEPRKPGRPKKSIVQNLQEAAVADHKQTLQKAYKEFEDEVDEMTEKAKEATQFVMDEIEAGRLDPGDEETLKATALAKYKELGGSDVLEVHSTKERPSNPGVVLTAQLPEKSNEEDKETKEMETTKEAIKFEELMTAFEAFVTVRDQANGDPATAIVLDMALAGLKSKTVGKVVE